MSETAVADAPASAEQPAFTTDRAGMLAVRGWIAVAIADLNRQATQLTLQREVEIGKAKRDEGAVILINPDPNLREQRITRRIMMIDNAYRTDMQAGVLIVNYLRSALSTLDQMLASMPEPKPLPEHPDCGHACCFAEPYGFVPEAGCPVHDVPISDKQSDPCTS